MHPNKHFRGYNLPILIQCAKLLLKNFYKFDVFFLKLFKNFGASQKDSGPN